MAILLRVHRCNEIIVTTSIRAVGSLRHGHVVQILISGASLFTRCRAVFTGRTCVTPCIFPRRGLGTGSITSFLFCHLVEFGQYDYPPLPPGTHRNLDFLTWTLHVFREPNIGLAVLSASQTPCCEQAIDGQRPKKKNRVRQLNGTDR